MRYIFIVKSKNTSANVNELENAIRDVGMTNPELRTRIEMRYTEYTGHATELAITISEQFGDKVAIVACGGDGTLNEVANAIAFRKTPLICVPLGTGNDFVRTIYPNKATRKVKYVVEHLDDFKFDPIDLVRVDSFDILGTHIPNWSRYFINIASIGLDTKVQANAKKILKNSDSKFVHKTAYLRAAAKGVFVQKENYFKYRLVLEDGTIYESPKSTHMLMAICNGRYYGNGFNPAPMAKIDDGIINICAVDTAGILRSMAMLIDYRAGKHMTANCVHNFKAISGIITSTDPSYQLMGNADGEDFFGNRIKFEVFPKALNLGRYKD